MVVSRNFDNGGELSKIFEALRDYQDLGLLSLEPLLKVL